MITACAELARRIVDGAPLKPGADGKKNATMNTWLSGGDTIKHTDGSKEERVLVVVGTYSIGKERIVKGSSAKSINACLALSKMMRLVAIARELNSKVYCDARKTAILRCQSDPELHALLTSNPLDANIHLLPLGMIASDRLKNYVERYKSHFTRFIGFRPTGWT